MPRQSASFIFSRNGRQRGSVWSVLSITDAFTQGNRVARCTYALRRHFSRRGGQSPIGDESSRKSTRSVDAENFSRRWPALLARYTQPLLVEVGQHTRDCTFK